MNKNNNKSKNNKNNKDRNYSTVNYYNIKDEKVQDENNDNDDNKTLRSKSKGLYSPSYNYNNYNDYKNENENEENSEKDNEFCKGCLLTAKNIFTEFRDKNKKSEFNPIRVNQRTPLNQNKIVKNKNNSYKNFKNNNNNTLFMDRNDSSYNNNNNLFRERSSKNIDVSNNTSRCNPKNDIYQLKDELLRKYGILNNNNDYSKKDNDNDYNDYKKNDYNKNDYNKNEYNKNNYNKNNYNNIKNNNLKNFNGYSNYNRSKRNNICNKLCNNSEYDKSIYLYKTEDKENISSNINRRFSFPKKENLDNLKNNDKNKDIDNENENDNNKDNNNDNENDNNNDNENESSNADDSGYKTPRMDYSSRLIGNRYTSKTSRNKFLAPIKPLDNNGNNKLKMPSYLEKFKKPNNNKNKNISYIASTPKFNNRFSRNDNNNILEEKNCLFKLLQNFIDQENKLKNIKQFFGNCSNSEIQNIFELFNMCKNGCVCCSDFCEILNCLSPNCSCDFSCDDVKYIFKRYDRPLECGFNFDEFCNIILPKRKIGKIFNNKRNSRFNCNINLSQNTRNKILELFTELIEGEKLNDDIRNNMSMISDNTFYDLFGEIKKKNKPGIQRDDINKFMKENGGQLKYDDIDIIMERMDKNKDGIIDYEEFIKEVQP